VEDGKTGRGGGILTKATAYLSISALLSFFKAQVGVSMAKKRAEKNFLVEETKQLSTRGGRWFG